MGSMRRLLAACAPVTIAAFAMACGGSAEPADETAGEPGVSGFVFNDRNGNGMRDKGEPGVEGWELHLCMGDACSSPATTGGGGHFHFDRIPPGQYQMILMDAHPGWQRTLQDCAWGTVILGQGEHKTADMAVRFVGEHVSGFGGSIWKDGAPVPEGTRIEALVGEKVCGETTTCGLRESRYFLWVISAREEGGCGEEDAEVRFRVDGTVVNQAAQWHDQDSATVDLFVGPELAVFEGPVFVYRPDTPNIMASEGTGVKAYVGDRLCGESAIFAAHPSPNSYQVVVLPDALRAGCGTEGASVRFTIGDEPVNEGAAWQPGVRRLTLSVGEPPPTSSPTPRPTVSPSPTRRPGKITPTATVGPPATATPRP